MDTQSVLMQLKAEREKIDAAIQALELLGVVSPDVSRAAQAGKNTSIASGKRGGKSTISAEGRARIAAAAKARWAKVKAARKAVKKGR